MKKLISIFCLALFCSIIVTSMDPYIEAMASGMEIIEKAQNADDFLEAANHFERIAMVAKDKWLPAYYTSYSRAIAASMISNPEKKDNVLDGAEIFLKSASKVDHDPSEVAALQGFIHMLRIAVDPGMRGQLYSGRSAASFQKAKAINPENPRALYLLAQLNYGTAQFFGSDTSEACLLNARAIALFKEGEQNQNSEQFAPGWGRSFAESFQEQCDN